MPNSYHFDLGDSTTGPVGFCARITADSEEEALNILIDALPTEYQIDSGVAGVEYIAVYFNADAIHVTDIDDTQDAGPDEDTEDPEADDEEGEDETR